MGFTKVLTYIFALCFISARCKPYCGHKDLLKKPCIRYKYNLGHEPLYSTTTPATSTSSTTLFESVSAVLSQNIIPLHHSSPQSTGSQNTKLTQILIKNNTNLNNPEDPVIFDGSNVGFLASITASKMWIDKSLFIKFLSEEEPSKIVKSVLIITGPARWGKTTILQMLKLYFDIPVDNNGEVIPLEQSSAYHYFMQGEIVRKDGTEMKFTNTPLISNYKRNSNHMCKHPVIELNGGNLDYKIGISSFRTMISGVYANNVNLYNRMKEIMKISDNYDKQFVEKDIDTFFKFYSDGVDDEAQLRNSIAILSRMMVQYYKIEHVVILYDEYDAYLRNAYLRSKTPPTEQQKDTFRSFLQGFMFASFKENKYLFRAVITGILNVEEASYLSSLNFVLSASVFQLKSLRYFYGVNQYELDELLLLRGVNETVKKEVVQWFDGYKDMEYPEYPVYSVYSISNFLNELKLKSYCGASSFNSNLRKLLDHTSFVNDYKILTKSKTLEISSSLFHKMPEDTYRIFQQLHVGEIKYISASHKDLVFNIMIVLGYATGSMKDDTIHVTIPNLEIRAEFEKVEWSILDEEIFQSTNEQLPRNDLINNITNFINDAEDNIEVVTSLTVALHTFFLWFTHGRNFANSPIKMRKPPTSSKNPIICSKSIEIQDIEKALLLNERPKEILEIKYDCNIVGNEAVVQALITLLFSGNFLRIHEKQWHSIPQFSFEVYPFKRSIPDLYVQIYNTAIIMELKYEDEKHIKSNSIDAAFEQSLRYACIWKMWRMNSNIALVKHVAIRVSRSCKIEVKSITFNPQEADKFLDDIFESLTEDVWKIIKRDSKDTPSIKLDKSTLNKYLEIFHSANNNSNRQIFENKLKTIAKKAIYCQWPPKK